MNNSVSSWRDDVSRLLGGLDERTKNIDRKMDRCFETQEEQDNRINKLETSESNRSAVQKKMVALIALLVSVVTVISNIAYKIVN